jgi:L-ascorbate metabolism protein UlaG (beta-lactamase superfamily)
MWPDRASRIALTTAALVAICLGTGYLLWNDRPNLDAIDWAAPSIEMVTTTTPTEAVTVTWLGVTTLLFDDGETQILIDGFFSRPTLMDILLRRDIDNDAAGINYVLNEFRMRRLAAIIPVHSHFDHAMDVGAIANRSSASVLGSESTAQIARGAGVPEDQIEVAVEHQKYQFGKFGVTLRPSSHAPVGWRGTIPLDGSIDKPLQMPQPISAFRAAESYSIVIEHPEGTALVHGSAGFVDGELRDVAADVVLLGVAQLTLVGKEYAQACWQNTVTVTGAHSVYALHFDDYTIPFGEVLPWPKVLGNFATTVRWLQEFRDDSDQDTSLFMPEFGKPIAIFAEPSAAPDPTSNQPT